MSLFLEFLIGLQVISVVILSGCATLVIGGWLWEDVRSGVYSKRKAVLMIGIMLISLSESVIHVPEAVNAAVTFLDHLLPSALTGTY